MTVVVINKKEFFMREFTGVESIEYSDNVYTINTENDSFDYNDSVYSIQILW